MRPNQPMDLDSLAHAQFIRRLQLSERYAQPVTPRKDGEADIDLLALLSILGLCVALLLMAWFVPTRILPADRVEMQGR